MFIFACPKTNQKGQPIACPPEADFRRGSQKTGDIGMTRPLGRYDRVAYPFFVEFMPRFLGYCSAT